MRGKKTNAEIRARYREEVSGIEALDNQWRGQGLTAEERARKAWSIRHEARIKARKDMPWLEAELLRLRDLAVHRNKDGPTFERLVRKGIKSGLTKNQVYEKIIKSSSRTNSNIDGIFDK